MQMWINTFATLLVVRQLNSSRTMFAIYMVLYFVLSVGYNLNKIRTFDKQ